MRIDTLRWLGMLVAAHLLWAVGVDAADGSQLAEAAKRRDAVAIQSLLKAGVDVNSATPDGATALHWASHWDDVDTVRRLLSAGARPDAANVYGITPLTLACSNGSTQMVKVLLEAGANPNLAQTNGETPLMTSSWTGNVEVVRLLLARGADPNVAPASHGQTALMWAASEHHTEVVKLLVERGANVSAISASRFTPLLFAARSGDLESARILASAGADVQHQAADGSTALLVATVRGHVPLALFLLEQGADPNAAGLGFTALHWAAGEWVTSLTGSTGVRTEGDEEWRALGGIPMRRVELIQALLSHGANPNARLVRLPPRSGFSRGGGMDRYSEGRNLTGATPFLLAAAAGDTTVMRMLVAGGADPGIKTSGNITPLMAAAGLGRIPSESFVTEDAALAAATLALDLGNDVNAISADGEAALHGAAQLHSERLVQFLVDRGAALNAVTKEGATPLTYAERILQYGSRPDVQRTSAGDLLRKLGAQ